jgi:hypothetical protein
VIPNLELFDETLDINSSANYDLSLEISPDRLAFCLLDTIRNKFVLLRSFSSDDNRKLKTEDIRDIIFKDDFLNRSFKSVRIVMPSAKCTLVPTPLFDPAHRDDYFLFNHLPVEDNIVLNNKVINPDAYIVFSVVQSLYDLVSTKFPDAQIMHHLKPMLLKASINHTVSSDKYLQLHIEKDYFNLIIYSDKKLKFCNTFSYRNVSDILYFVMYTFTNLGINQEETLFISGLSEHFDELFTNISEYILTVKFAKPSVSSTYSYVFNELGLQKYINLFNSTNCE